MNMRYGAYPIEKDNRLFYNFLEIESEALIGPISNYQGGDKIDFD
jgi:hypothetical protein